MTKNLYKKSSVELTEVSDTDAMGNPLVLPHWYPGSMEQFKKEVAKLKPDHCSWPNGQRAHVKGKRCCTNIKTAAGPCLDHLGTMLPVLHGQNLDRDRTSLVVRSLRDPKLTELLINTFYSEENLERAAKKCQNGALSTKSLDLLAKTMLKCWRHYKGYKDHQERILSIKKIQAGLSPSNSQYKAMSKEIKLKTTYMIQEYDQLGHSLELIDKIVSTAKKDEANWKALSQANAESIETKKAVAQVEALKKDQVSQDEVKRTFVNILQAVEDAVTTAVDRDTKNEIMETIYKKIVASPVTFEDE